MALLPALYDLRNTDLLDATWLSDAPSDLDQFGNRIDPLSEAQSLQYPNARWRNGVVRSIKQQVRIAQGIDRNAFELGVVGDGSDETAAFTAAVAAVSAAGGGVLRIPLSVSAGLVVTAPTLLADVRLEYVCEGTPDGNLYGQAGDIAIRVDGADSLYLKGGSAGTTGWIAAGASGIDDGTVTHAIPRWDGSQWVEEPDFLVDASGNTAIGGTLALTGVLTSQANAIFGNAAASAADYEVAVNRATNGTASLRLGTYAVSHANARFHLDATEVLHVQRGIGASSYSTMASWSTGGELTTYNDTYLSNQANANVYIGAGSAGTGLTLRKGAAGGQVQQLRFIAGTVLGSADAFELFHDSSHNLLLRRRESSAWVQLASFGSTEVTIGATGRPVRIIDDVDIDGDGNVDGVLTVNAATLGLGDVRFLSNEGSMTLHDTEANSTNKSGRYQTPGYDNSHYATTGMHIQCMAAENRVNLGGGTSFGRAATRIALFTTSAVGAAGDAGTARVTVIDASTTVANPLITSSDRRVSNNTYTAGTTQTQAGGTACATETCSFTTVATVGDAATLPTVSAGLKRTIVNRGANAMQLFPFSGQAIEGYGTDTQIWIPVNGRVLLEGRSATVWNIISSTPANAIGQKLEALSATNLPAAYGTSGALYISLRPGLDDYVQGQFVAPYTGTIELRVAWAMETAASANVRVRLDVAQIAQGASLTGALTAGTAFTVAASNTVNRQTSITPTNHASFRINITEQSLVILKLVRPSADAADTHTGNLHVIEMRVA